jgi:hypothetical protein
MNIVELEAERTNRLLKWWSQPEASELIACLERVRQKKMLEYSDLVIKGTAETNANFIDAANITLAEAVELERTIKVLKEFFPDGPFIARIEL